MAERDAELPREPQAILRALAQRALQPDRTPGLSGWSVRAVAHVLEASACALFEMVEGREALQCQAATGAGAEGAVGVRVPVSASSQPGHTLRRGAAVVVPDLRAETRFAPVLPAAEREAASSVSVIIPGEEAPHGVLIAYADRVNAFGDADVLFMQAAAGVLATAIARRRAEERLHESEARVRSILETTVDAIITIDASGRVGSFNRAAERIFGYTAGEVVGRNIAMLMPEPYRSEHDGYLENYCKTGRRQIIGIGREVTGRRKDGTVFPMYLAVSEVPRARRRLFTGIVRDITEQRRLEHEVLRISDEERRRIGQDLHDGLGQMLTGIALISSNLARRLDREGAAGASEVSEIASLVKEADQYARGLARGLVPVELEQGGLRGALRRLARNAERLFGVRCTVSERGGAPVADLDVAMHLYRIAQEAVSNAVRHGKASSVSIQLDAGTASVRLRVRDDGTGFTEGKTDTTPTPYGELRGMGIRIMHYRARIIGASLEVHSAADEGTTVTCRLRRHGETPARSIEPQLEGESMRPGDGEQEVGSKPESNP